jgi:zinc protease
MKYFLRLLLLSLLIVVASCRPSGRASFNIEYTKYTLDNGLDVVLHNDKSDPIVSVAILYHVGSNREEVGRTGFAHLFEHILFQESQHVGQDQFFKKIQAAGGTLNGGTSNDQTVYFEVVPNNALEMVLWLESDRMGWLLSTVTEDAFVNQQNVVQNEKRQRVDNRPYGHTGYVIDKLIYPEGHPYNWQVIGSFEDLKNASLKDVRDFYRKWYGPNNATLVIAGDFDDAQTREWVEKYFGEIESGPDNPDPEVRRTTLDETKRVFVEDNFARSPELNMVFPTVEEYSDDSYALSLLGELVSDGKDSPLYKTVVEDEKLAPSASAYQSSNEIAGVFKFRIRAFPGTGTQELESAVQTALDRFEEERFTAEDLDRIKAKTETNFYNSISSVLGKSFNLAAYNEFTGSPGFIEEDIQKSLDVTEEDIWRVYDQYIKGKNFVSTSFVPMGQTDLVMEDAERFPLVEETIQSAGVEELRAPSDEVIEPIPSVFDRSVEPAKGPAATTRIPEVWSNTYTNGLRIYGIEQDELPLVQFSVTLAGGMTLDNPEKIGVANLMTDIMMEGTANRTPVELEKAIDALGASIRMSTSSESIMLTANTLVSRLPETYALVEEILLEPRWDENELPRIKQETTELINRWGSDPSMIASNVFRKVLYGPDNILGNSTLGSKETVASITMDDLKEFYSNYFSSSVANITIAGAISEQDAINLFRPLEEKWADKPVQLPLFPTPQRPEKSRLFFVDVPGAKQSEIRIGYLALKYNDPEYYPATVMNYKLGGSFNSFVNMILREEKGYTYGAFSNFSGSRYVGPFTASSAVRSNVTYESVEIFRDEMRKYRDQISDDDLTFTKDAMTLSNARRFETLGALRGMLTRIANYDLPFDYVSIQEAYVRTLDSDEHMRLAKKYIDPERMVYLVVGDAATQKDRLRGLGFGKPIMLSTTGE